VTDLQLAVAAPDAPAEEPGAATHCPYCALQCAQTLHREPGAGSEPRAETEPGAGPTAPPVRVEGREFPTNRGRMCQKGWTSAALLPLLMLMRKPHMGSTVAMH